MLDILAGRTPVAQGMTAEGDIPAGTWVGIQAATWVGIQAETWVGIQAGTWVGIQVELDKLAEPRREVACKAVLTDQRFFHPFCLFFFK